MLLLGSCEEWDQVFTGDYGEADVYEPVTLETNKTIKALKDMYVSGGVKIEEDIIIGGQVVSEDKSGNIYKSIYIQDETGGIEVKIGKTGLYNDYKLGQWVYVKCSGMKLGDYNGMKQIGLDDPTGDYETSYIEETYFIANHIYRGEMADPLEPKEVSVANLTSSENLGCYVRLKNVTYGSIENPYGEIFCLVYLDSDKDKKVNTNRIFLSGTGQNYSKVDDPSWGITTWAMSKQGFLNYLNAGTFDKGWVNDYSRQVSDPEVKATLQENASAYSVSQYFTMTDASSGAQKEVQVRTSGYARFADYEIDPDIRGVNGTKKAITLTGILTVYSGAAQFTLIDLESGVTAE